MKNAMRACRCVAGILGILGMVLLTSCDSDSGDDIVGLEIVNQTSVLLSIFVDGGRSPGLTVPADSNNMLIIGAGTHEVIWQGGGIQGDAEFTLQQDESKTLTIRGSGNDFSLK
jgi:hypothetical protein